MQRHDTGARCAHGWGFRALAFLLLMLLSPAPAQAASGGPLVGEYLETVVAADLVPGADAFGEIREDLPVVPALSDGKTIGWVFLTSDFVPTTGYSGKPIHTLVGISDDAVVTGVRLMKHSEPIVLVGIPEAKIKAVTERYAGLDLNKEAAGEDTGHDLDIVSGATVTIMVIDDSIRRAAIKVAKALSLGSFEPETGPAGPQQAVDRSADAVQDWQTLSGDGSLRHFVVDVPAVNQDFAALGDERTEKHVEPGPDTDPYIDLWVGLASQPSIGRSLLGDAAYDNLEGLLEEGDEAILIAGNGRWSFKGSGYVRGGIFDRIQVIQDDVSHRFRDREHRRVVRIVADGAPGFEEADLFIVPASVGFDPAKPWRLQLLVQRAVGPIEKVFLTYDVGYDLPERYLKTIAPRPRAETAAASDAPAEAVVPEDAADIRNALWTRIWQAKRTEIVILGAGLLFLTALFFFQSLATRNERVFGIIRTVFLVFTLFFIGWYANAQLSVVNVLAFASAVFSDFRWETFLMDPLIFLLWFAVAAALLFWARGAYCGWLCPFGALQELTNKIARALRVPQVTLPWGLHERLWPVKYIIFLGLFGLSLYSLSAAEHYAEVEPFKTAIILKFDRSWPYVLFALACLAPGLFIERFYCRYVCPLGAGLAIPARLHMFRWLKRYKECGNPCQTCAHECPVQAIHPTGEINPNECISCLHCQVLYQHTKRCPVVVARIKKRERFEKQIGIKPSGPAQPAVQTPARDAPAPAS
ncbi:NosR/NirI family protein [Jiella pacifica]|uniref:4Fe-4S binding protein n=1 Tax=Jiella pacifica TaxID=2696469 RepID=A0A6N9T8C5_9HYPH|nr:NosR/NirI family protein [Jiella pacifica]NDW07674.1 4Fe-4S binding protein [Jiella pacifica]